MAVYNFDDLARTRYDNLTHKVAGLAQLHRLGVPVPEALFLAEQEYLYFVENGVLSKEAQIKIHQFISDITISNHLPLFSIRCESKYYSTIKEQRPPHSLLNVGIRVIDWEKYMSIGIAEIDKFKKVSYNTFQERVIELFGEERTLPVKSSLMEEIIFWICCVYQRFTEGTPSFNPGIMLQRMVFGNWDDRSGNGICCNLPGEVTAETRFKGVFLPYQQGVSLCKNCWGPGEINLSELLKVNNTAYFQLRGIFEYLEMVFGPNRYLEYTVEGERVYITEHITRQRRVLANE